MCFKQLKIRKLLFVLGMLAIVFASEAQNKKFQLVLNSEILWIKNYKRWIKNEKGVLEEFAPKGIYEFEFEYNNGLTITSPRLGGDLLEMSNNLIYAEDWVSGDLVCTLYDGDSYNGHDFTKCFTYSKGKLSTLTISKRLFMGGWGIVFVDETETTNICSTTVENDPLIKFMRSISGKKQTPKNNNPSPKSTPTPKYGEIKLSGHNYERVWNVDSQSYMVLEPVDGAYPFCVKTGSDNHIYILNCCIGSTIKPSNKSNINWTTRKGAIRISLPTQTGVSVGNNDEIICWEDSENPMEIKKTMFIWSQSTGKLQCIQTIEFYFGSRIIENMYYFVTTDASAWSKIKPMLLYNLPFCGNRIN